MRFHVHNLGCKVNRVESDTITAALLRAGLVSSGISEADVAVVNTCTVTAEADTKTRKAIRQASRACSGAVIVTGCAAAIDPQRLESLGDNVIVEPGRQAAIERALSICGLDPHAGSRSRLSRSGESFHTRMGIKVQDGCNNRCTYCIVNRARGKSVSVPVDEVVSEVVDAVSQGTPEIVLTGVNIGSYRFEREDGSVARLPQLIRELLERTDIRRIRLSSIEPPDVDAELISVLEDYPQRFCAHFHMPLQSGCDATLKAMGRLYSTEEYARRVAAIREVRPDAAITTDVIAGFPQESDADFEESLSFCRSMGFSKIHVFRYSVRPQTPAAEMDGQVKPETKACRASILRELSDEMGRDAMLSRVGKTELVAIERDGFGMTESYHEVVVEGQGAKRGALIPVELVGIDDDMRFIGREA